MEVKKGCRQRVQQDQGTMPLVGFVGRVLWGSWAKAEFVNSNKKSGVLVSFAGVLSKWCTRRKILGRCR